MHHLLLRGVHLGLVRVGTVVDDAIHVKVQIVYRHARAVLVLLESERIALGKPSEELWNTCAQLAARLATRVHSAVHVLSGGQTRLLGWEAAHPLRCHESKQANINACAAAGPRFLTCCRCNQVGRRHLRQMLSLRNEVSSGHGDRSVCERRQNRSIKWLTPSSLISSRMNAAGAAP
jgi:hypothetical protein